MNVSENVCHVCKTKNEPEAVVCGHCGTRLDDPFTDLGHKTKTSDMQAVTPEMIRDWSLNKSKDIVIPESGIAFYVNGYSKPAFIDTEGEFIIGRKTDTTSEKLLDLAPFGGYSMGLSRRHVVVKRTREGYEVLDLGSVNGTWLEEERLVPHKLYPLPSGSHLRLAQIRLYVIYRPFAETK